MPWRAYQIDCVKKSTSLTAGPSFLLRGAANYANVESIEIISSGKSMLAQIISPSKETMQKFEDTLEKSGLKWRRQP